MDKRPHDRIVGMDVSCDWLDILYLPSSQRQRLPNTKKKGSRSLPSSIKAIVCFEATSGQEWRLRSALDAERGATRQLPPSRIKAVVVSRGTLVKTDRIDAKAATGADPGAWDAGVG